MKGQIQADIQIEFNSLFQECIAVFLVLGYHLKLNCFVFN